MGIVWEAYHKGVPLLRVPGITLEELVDPPKMDIAPSKEGSDGACLSWGLVQPSTLILVGSIEMVFFFMIHHNDFI